MRCKIVDWAGNETYPGRTFPDVATAWDFLTEDQHKRHPHVTDDEFDTIMGEFETAEAPDEDDDGMSAEELQGRKDADADARYDASIDDKHDEAFRDRE